MTLFHLLPQLCFTQATCHTNQQRAQQDSLSRWAPSHFMQAGDVDGVSSSPGYHKSLPVWQMAVALIKVIQNYTHRTFSSMYFKCGSFQWQLFRADRCWLQCCLSSHRADMSVGLLFKLSEVLSVMAMDFCEHIALIFISWVRLTPAIWLRGGFSKRRFKTRYSTSECQDKISTRKHPWREVLKVDLLK